MREQQIRQAASDDAEITISIPRDVLQEIIKEADKQHCGIEDLITKTLKEKFKRIDANVYYNFTGTWNPQNYTFTTNSSATPGYKTKRSAQDIANSIKKNLDKRKFY